MTISAIDWLVLLWDLTEYFKIISFGDNWFKIDIQNSFQRENFYKKVVECGEIQENNFYVSMDNDLWRTHKRNADNNIEILEKIIKEYRES